MKDWAIRIGKHLCGRLLRPCLCLSVFFLSGSAGHLLWAGQAVSVTVKVCVIDEAGKPVDVKPTLYNAAGKIDQKDGDCYKSKQLSLEPEQLYFVAAVSDKRATVAPLQVNPTDQKKEILISLKFQSPAQPINPAIEVCLRDKDNKPIELKGVVPGGNDSFVPESSTDAGCLRVRSAPANEYKLTLATEVGRGDLSSSFGSAWLRNLALLMMALACSILTVILFLRIRQIPTNTAMQECVSRLSTTLVGLTAKTEQIALNVANLRPVGAPPAVTSGTQAASGSGTAEPVAQSRTPPNEFNQKLPVAPQLSHPPEGAVSDAVHEDRSRSEAKQQYRSFSSGDSVEHFYLMPSGSSSATNMVEDSRIELREQNNGTYVAFRSRDNENEAWVFPMPGNHFTSETFKALFSALTADQYDSGEIDPKPVILLEPKLWKLNG